jgi:hypothetical protein
MYAKGRAESLKGDERLPFHESGSEQRDTEKKKAWIRFMM